MRFLRFSCVLPCLLLLVAAAGADDKDKKDIDVSGQWAGSFSYPPGSMQPDVEFSAVLIQKDGELTGYTREPNTFGTTDDPFLHATLKGKIDLKTRKFTLTKTYDGTSGVEHDVEYTGEFPAEGDKIDAGVWKIVDQDFAGTFKLAKDAKVKTGKLFGVWQGTNAPPKDADIPAAKAEIVLFHKGDEIVGFAREPRAAPDGTNPWFHATLKGTYDEKSGEIKLTKTYDGTAKSTGKEEYTGKLTDGGKLEGKRKAGDIDAGTFELERGALKIEPKAEPLEVEEAVF